MSIETGVVVMGIGVIVVACIATYIGARGK